MLAAFSLPLAPVPNPQVSGKNTPRAPASEPRVFRPRRAALPGTRTAGDAQQEYTQVPNRRSTALLLLSWQRRRRLRPFLQAAAHWQLHHHITDSRKQHLMKSTPAAARRPPKDKGGLVPPCPPLLLRASISPWGAASRFATWIGEGERGNTQWMEAVGRAARFEASSSR